MQLSVFELYIQSGLVGKLVGLSLLLASVLSWSIIFMKWRTIKFALIENANFLNTFWHGKSIDEVFARSDEYPRSPVALVFKSGVKELRKVSNADGTPEERGVDNVQRALMRQSNFEISALERHVGWLASTASAAPFIGLFGTVWGIMGAFHNIGASGSANLAVVAPGIAEALINTALGIGAAIPPVIAYNHFGGQIRRLAVDMDNFTHDFLNIVQRGIVSRKKGN